MTVLRDWQSCNLEPPPWPCAIILVIFHWTEEFPIRIIFLHNHCQYHPHHHHPHPHQHHHTGRGVGERDLNQIYQLHLQDSESSPRDFIPTSEIHFLFKTKIHFAFKPKYTSYSKPKFVLCPKPKYIFVGSKSQRRSFHIWNWHALGRSEISSVPFVQHFQIHY